MRKQIFSLLAFDAIFTFIVVVVFFINQNAFLVLFDKYPVAMIALFVGVFGLGPSLIFVLPFHMAAKKARLLQQTGIPAKGTIIGIAGTGITYMNKPMVKLTLNVEPTFGSPFEVTIETLIPRATMPRVGDVLPVKYDPANPQNLIVDYNTSQSFSATTPAGSA